MRKINFLYVLITAFLLSGCSSNRWDIDISDVNIEQNFYRFDIELFSINQDSVWSYVPYFNEKYGTFFDLYNRGVINIGGSNQFNYADNLLKFITDPYISETYNVGNKLFKDNLFKQPINDAFKRYHYYFPDRIIPDIYTHISGFNQSMVIDSTYISISLDKYLGSNSKYYEMLRTPVYLRYSMNPDKIPSDVMMSWALTEFPFEPKNDNLSSHMIYYGMMHMFLDAMLPNTPDTLKWGMTAEKLKWCTKNDRQMWLYLIENKMLFNSSYKDIKRFIDDGPFTTPFSKQSPARTGRWLGYEIVKSYMKHHSKMTLKELMESNNYQEILNESRYKP